MKRTIGLLAFLLIAPAAAQQAAQQSPMEQALSQRLSAEIGASLQSAAAIIELQRQLAAAQARIKEMETKSSVPPNSQ
jgi:hypothetical protein